MAAQFSAKNGPWARVLSRWMARAATSLPVPLSPVISTVARVGATWPSKYQTSFMAADAPVTSGGDCPYRPPSVASCRFSMARSRIIFSAAGCTGFSIYQNAPSRWTVSSAASTLPNPVNTIARALLPDFASSLNSPFPSSTGILRSVITMSASKLRSRTSASDPLHALTTL